MGGHSKKAGRGGGGGGKQSQHHRSAGDGPKTLRRDPGVPDLKAVTQRMTSTIKKRNRSLLSVTGGSGVSASSSAAGSGGGRRAGLDALVSRLHAVDGGGKGHRGGTSEPCWEIIDGEWVNVNDPAFLQQQQQHQQQHAGGVGGANENDSENEEDGTSHNNGNSSNSNNYGSFAEDNAAMSVNAQRSEMASLALRSQEKAHDHYQAQHLAAGGLGYRGSLPSDAAGDGLEEESGLVSTYRGGNGGDRSLRRFFKEFQKVVESSNVILQVVDARDPLGCRLVQLEQTIRSLYGDDGKHLVLVLNKVDMLPSRSVADEWIQYFEQHEKIMCIPFSATAKGSEGQFYTHNLFRRLRALARAPSGASQQSSQSQQPAPLAGGTSNDGGRRAIVVGVIGYPNVGKSSVINALKRKNVVGVGNMPGFTTGNTEVELRSDIRVMDCPGVVTPGEDAGDVVLRNAVRVSDLQNPFTPVQRLLQRCTDVHVLGGGGVDGGQPLPGARLLPGGLHPLAVHYGIGTFDPTDVMDFIQHVGRRRGRLTKGGVVDEEETARMILQDWNDGRIAYYTLPPVTDDFFARGEQHFASGGANAGGSAVYADGGEDAEAEAADAVRLVKTAARGITVDGLPTFQLWLDQLDGDGGSAGGHRVSRRRRH